MLNPLCPQLNGITVTQSEDAAHRPGSVYNCGMRVGIDCRLPYYQIGGISQYTLFLIQALAQLDGDSEYRIYHSRKDSQDYTPADDRFWRRSLWTPCHHRLERWSLALELLPERLDVFHSPDFIPPAGGASRRIITVHDLNFHYFPEFLTAESRRYYNDQIAWAVQAADAISADSEHTRQDLIRLLAIPPAKVQTIHLSVNPVYQAPAIAADVAATLARLGLAPGFILFVGTMEPRKNIPTLLQAYALARADHGVRVPLVLVGRRGWLYEEIFATIEALKLREHVVHLDQFDNQSLAHLYHSAGLLALPSHYEGFGLPPLEAMNCGCPVVTSDRGSLPEIVGPAGPLLPPDDVDLWAETLARILADGAERERLIAAGHQQASRFSWARAAEETRRLYQGL